MKEYMEINVRYTEYQGVEELSDSEKVLVRKAKDASKSSYSPYSNFKVGASVLLENGEFICGSNQENGAYPSGLCAERVTLFYAGSKFPGVPIVAMAVTANYMGEVTEQPVAPCGACRQVMFEYRNIGHRPYALLMIGREKIIKVEDVQFLLPFSFSNATDAAKK